GPLPQAQVFGEPQLHTDGALLALTFASDGSLWSVEDPGMLRHWNAASGQQLGAGHDLSDLETLWAFSGDARLLASSSTDSLSVGYVMSVKMLPASRQQPWATPLAFAHDPPILPTGHDAGVFRQWDAATHHLAHEFRLHKRAISALAF